ncbi:hypothetical protein GCM10023230_19320 [Flavobacterium hankyongi]|uniref:Uncharacterized protein n=1 Tax=Flavobacterium hankyongi TaxID=1176532 RepID=A0ABP9A013_9FLAO
MNLKDNKITKSNKTSIIKILTLIRTINFGIPLKKSCFPLVTIPKFSQIRLDKSIA